MNGPSHFKYAASAAHRWMECGKSVELSEGVEDRPGRYAERGTRLHEVAYRRLVGEIPDGHAAADDAEGEAIVREYVDYVRSRSGVDFCEVKTEVVPDLCGGTADAVVYDSRGGVLEVVDLKTGSGVKVFAKENLQLAIYALGVLRKYVSVIDPREVKLTIVQPALGHVDTWKVETLYLATWGEKIRHRVANLEAGRGVDFAPSEGACRWCPARSTCPALQERAQAAAREAFGVVNDPDDPNPRPLNTFNVRDLALADKFELVPLVRAWAKAVEDEATRALLEGEDVPGFKVVEGRKGNRTWSDQKGARRYLEDQGLDEVEIYTEPKMVSPAQAERVLKAHSQEASEFRERKSGLAGFVAGGRPGAPTVVREDDPRPAFDREALARRDLAGFLKDDRDDG